MERCFGNGNVYGNVYEIIKAGVVVKFDFDTRGDLIQLFLEGKKALIQLFHMKKMSSRNYMVGKEYKHHCP